MAGKNWTPEEIDALPEGPFARERTPVTFEMRLKGVGGKYIERPVAKAVKVRGYEPGEPMAFLGTDGRAYRVGEWEDGGFFRQLFMPI